MKSMHIRTTVMGMGLVVVVGPSISRTTVMGMSMRMGMGMGMGVEVGGQVQRRPSVYKTTIGRIGRTTMISRQEGSATSYRTFKSK